MGDQRTQGRRRKDGGSRGGHELGYLLKGPDVGVVSFLHLLLDETLQLLPKRLNTPQNNSPGSPKGGYNSGAFVMWTFENQVEKL